MITESGRAHVAGAAPSAKDGHPASQRTLLNQLIAGLVRWKQRRRARPDIESLCDGALRDLGLERHSVGTKSILSYWILR